jgi:predicted MPP superfamily phosphohydrolase
MVTILLAPILLLLLALAFACLAYAVCVEPYRPMVRRHVVRVPEDWPAISILHLSDLHVRRGADRLWKVQRAALDGLTPDLLVVTGDLLEEPTDAARAVQLLDVVQPRLGRYAILGNHEHGAHRPTGRNAPERSYLVGPLHLALRLLGLEIPRAPEKDQRVVKALQAAGLRVLQNEGVRVTPATGQTLWVAGCDSGWARKANIRKAMDGRDMTEGCLVLVHEPELAVAAAQEGADLILAGHSHGGQVQLPGIGALYTHRTDPRIHIASGFQRLGQALVHVSAGLGHTIPLRFRCPPEVVWLDCVPVEMSPLDRVHEPRDGVVLAG